MLDRIKYILSIEETIELKFESYTIEFENALRIMFIKNVYNAALLF